MTLVNCYLSVQAMRDALDDTTETHEADYERAITAASRKIDDWCGLPALPRFFWREDTPSARLFTPVRRRWLLVGDFADTAGMVVRTDDDGDGVFETTWDAGEWTAEPLVRPAGHPFTAIAATGARRFPLYGTYQGPPRLEVTARWGWPAIPAEVEEACLILAVALFKAMHLSGRELGFDELASGVGPIGLAAQLVAHLRFDPDRPLPGGGPPTGGG